MIQDTIQDWNRVISRENLFVCLARIPQEMAKSENIDSVYQRKNWIRNTYISITAMRLTSWRSFLLLVPFLCFLKQRGFAAAHILTAVGRIICPSGLFKKRAASAFLLFIYGMRRNMNFSGVRDTYPNLHLLCRFG